MDYGGNFNRLERAIADKFLPALHHGEVSAVERQLYGLPVRCGGMGVHRAQTRPQPPTLHTRPCMRAAAAHLVKAIRGKVQLA